MGVTKTIIGVKKVSQEETQTQTVEALEKALLKAILKAGRILVYYDEVGLLKNYEIKDKYMFRYYNKNNDSNILMLPDLLQLDETEINIFNKIFDLREEMGIDELAEMIANYVNKKQQTCLKTGHVWLLLLQKAREYFEVEEHYSEFDAHAWVGRIKYIIKEDNITLATIIENVDYCNKCFSGADILVSAQRCTKYEVERNE